MGPPQTLCDAPVDRGGTWSRDGVILFAPVVDGPLYRVSASGGLSTAVTRFDPPVVRALTGGRSSCRTGATYVYLVTSFGRGRREKMGIYVGSLDSKRKTFLVPANSTLAYAPPGYLLFLRERNLVAQAFDARASGSTGDPLPVAEEIQYFPQTLQRALLRLRERGCSSISRNRPGRFATDGGWIEAAGRSVRSARRATWPIRGSRPTESGSPWTSRITRRETWTSGSTSLSGGVATRLTSDPAIDAGPIWSPDGQRIAFMSLASRSSRSLSEERERGGGRGANPPLGANEVRNRLVAGWAFHPLSRRRRNE